MRYSMTNPRAARCSTGVAALLILLLAVTAWAAPSAFRQETVDGVLHIHNPATAPGDIVVTKQPEELWRIGGEDDEEGELLGNIADAEVDDEGTIYLLDAMINTVKVYSPDGELLRNIGRSGEGPGEWNNARDLMLMPDGSVGVIRMMPSRIIRLEKDGTPAASFEMPTDGGDMGMGMIRASAAGDDRIVLSTLAPRLAEGAIITTAALASYDIDGTKLATFCAEESRNEGGRLSIQANDDDNFSTTWDLDDDGRVFVSPAFSGYRIDVYGADGSLERVVKRDYESVRRSDDEMEELREQAEEIAAMVGAESVPVNPYGRDIRRVIARPDGEMWVLTGEGLRDRPENTVGVFDVFDAEGKYQRQVGLRADYNPDRDRWVLTDEHLFIMKEGLSVPTSMSSGSGGAPGTQTMMVTIGGSSNDDDEDDEEAAPYCVICYRLN